MAAATLGLMGFVSPGGGEMPLRPEPAVAARVAPSSGATRAVKGADGLFYITARVNGTPVRFVIDTGANVVVLTDRDARRAGVVAGRGSQRLETASGGSRMSWATIDEVELAGQTLTRTRAAVVADGLKMSLLGQNALAQMESVTLRRGQLELR